MRLTFQRDTCGDRSASQVRIPRVNMFEFSSLRVPSFPANNMCHLSQTGSDDLTATTFLLTPSTSQPAPPLEPTGSDHRVDEPGDESSSPGRVLRIKLLEISTLRIFSRRKNTVLRSSRVPSRTLPPAPPLPALPFITQNRHTMKQTGLLIQSPGSLPSPLDILIRDWRALYRGAPFHSPTGCSEE